MVWKAFFRANATFITRCNFCYDAVRQMERAQRLSKLPKRAGVTRAADISSDEDLPEQSFAPMVVSRSSSGARVVSKWLVAARKRLGGVFPRPHAKVCVCICVPVAIRMLACAFVRACGLLLVLEYSHACCWSLHDLILSCCCTRIAGVFLVWVYDALMCNWLICNIS